MDTIYENEPSMMMMDDFRKLRISNAFQSVANPDTEAVTFRYGPGVTGKSRADNLIVHDFEANEAFFAFYNAERSFNNSIPVYNETLNTTRKGHTWTTTYRHPQRSKRIMHGNVSKSTNQCKDGRSGKADSRKLIRKATKKRADMRRRNVERSHKSGLQYHVHDNNGIVTMTEATCPLCCMGIPLRFDNANSTENEHQASSSATCPENVDESSHEPWTTCDLMDALTVCNEVGNGTDTPIARPVLPLEAVRYTQLAGGPSGYATLLTTSACMACRCPLDAFACIGGDQALIVADHNGSDCYHFYCAMKETMGGGTWIGEWCELLPVFVSRNWYLYGIQPQE